MTLHLADKLLLLALDDNKGTFNADSLTFNYAIAGACIAELMIDGSIENKDNLIHVLSHRSHSDDALDYCLKRIRESKKNKSIKWWIDHFGNRGDKIRKLILKKLISEGILAEKESKFLWIIPNNKYPAKNSIPENKFRARLQDIILNNQTPEADEIMLISLIDSCNLNKEVYGKKISKNQRERIKEVINSSKLAENTSKVLKEIHDVIVTSIVVLMASSTVATNT